MEADPKGAFRQEKGLARTPWQEALGGFSLKSQSCDCSFRSEIDRLWCRLELASNRREGRWKPNTSGIDNFRQSPAQIDRAVRLNFSPDRS